MIINSKEISQHYTHIEEKGENLKKIWINTVKQKNILPHHPQNTRGVIVLRLCKILSSRTYCTNSKGSLYAALRLNTRVKWEQSTEVKWRL